MMTAISYLRFDDESFIFSEGYLYECLYNINPLKLSLDDQYSPPVLTAGEQAKLLP